MGLRLAESGSAGEHAPAPVAHRAEPAPAGTRYVLTDARDTGALLRHVYRLTLGSRASVLVRSPIMDERAQHRWERRLTFWLHACGCLPGGLLAVVAMVWRAFMVLDTPPRTIASAAVHLAWILGAGLVGKVVGLLTARVLLAVDLARLGRYLSTPPTPSAEVSR